MIRRLAKSVHICRDDAPRPSARASSLRRVPSAPGRGSRRFPTSLPGRGHTSSRCEIWRRWDLCRKQLRPGFSSPCGADGAEVVRLRAAGDFFLGERHAEVAIEIAAAGRDPGKAPAHPLLERRELLQRPAGDEHQRDIPSLEMLDRSVHVIRQVRAARATLVPIGTKHEVIRGELAPPVEQIREAQFALRPCEDIFLLDPGPGKLAPLASELVAQVASAPFPWPRNRCERAAIRFSKQPCDRAWRAWNS